MRDINRIPEVLAYLSKVWYNHPDLRLGQLINNAVPNEAAIYYIEDEDLLANLKHTYEEE